MKIGFDAKRAFLNATGLGNYSRDLIRSLVQYFPEHHYYLFTPKHIDNSFYRWAKEQSNVYVVEPSIKGTSFTQSYWRSFRMLKYAGEFELDIFHGLSGEIPKIHKGNTVKTIVTIHDLIFMRYPEQYKAIDRFFYTQKARYACRKADKIVAISEQTKSDIIKFLHVPAHHISVVYQTCHHVFYSESVHTIPAGLPQKFLLYVGSIEERKNLKALIQALPMVGDIPLVVIGKKTAYWRVVEQELNNLNLKDRFVYLENLSMGNLAAIYRQAEVFVYPSVFEGFGIPIIEALFSGVPVITNSEGCFEEAAGEGALYVDVKNPSAIAEVIRSILNHTELRNNLIQGGREHVQQFLPQAIAQDWMSVYQQLHNV
ncbi:MAG: glycosyltransferase family 4 protein [Flavobacteriales bacterium]